MQLKAKKQNQFTLIFQFRKINIKDARRICHEIASLILARNDDEDETILLRRY